jgi:hypothetical protein
MVGMAINPPVTLLPPPWRGLSVRLGPACGDAEPTSRGQVLVADGTVLALAGNYLRLPEVDPGRSGYCPGRGRSGRCPVSRVRWEAFSGAPRNAHRMPKNGPRRCEVSRDVSAGQGPFFCVFSGSGNCPNQMSKYSSNSCGCGRSATGAISSVRL